jgi:flavin reductase (DIM6/NTAB) family NADH-FMN oxidoreductase RutF
MFYEPKEGHGLKYDPFKSLVVPRPIGWISTVDEEGRPNLAPYSFFNAMSAYPPCVVFGGESRSNGELKDSVANARDTGGFVVNIVSYEQREAMCRTARALPHGESEFTLGRLETLPSMLVGAPRVKGAPAHLECRYLQTVELPSTRPNLTNHVVFGEVIGVHVQDALVVDGRVDICRAVPIARMGYRDYAKVTDAFELHWPDYEIPT